MNSVFKMHLERATVYCQDITMQTWRYCVMAPKPRVLSGGGQLTEVLILVYMVAYPLRLCATCKSACKADNSDVPSWILEMR